MNHWHSEPLAQDHELGGFDCGVPELNQWLTGQARRAQAADTARTYVWAEGDGTVVAYYSIAPTRIFRSQLSGKQASLAGGYTVVPAYLLAKLALDQSLHGQGRGADLLVDALTTIVRASATGAGRLIVVDAIDENAAAFYQHHDFLPVPAGEEGTQHRLVMKVATARSALGLAQLSFTPNPSAQLGSLVLSAPDGTAVPIVMSMTEYQTIMERLTDAEPGAPINLSQLLLDVLGHNPFQSG